MKFGHYVIIVILMVIAQLLAMYIYDTYKENAKRI